MRDAGARSDRGRRVRLQTGPEDPMLDVLYVALTFAVFAAVALVAKAVERR